MSVVTLADRELLVIVENGAPEIAWMDGRDEGVTASEVHSIASGSRKTWRRILDDKLNGSTFKGNAATKRGHEREAYILAEARILEGVVTLASSGALFGSHHNALHRATPDGLGIHSQLGEVGAEVKSHHADWTFDGIPADHFDQMQWGMHVTGLDWWLYAGEVDGQPGIQHHWIARDDKRIAQLTAQADAFIEWRAAGAPEIDDIPDDVDDALAEYAHGLALESEGKRLKTAARKQIDEFAAAQASAPGDPLRRNGSRAQLFFEPKPDTIELDEEAWAAAEPDGHAEWVAARDRVAEQRTAALALYSRSKPTAPTFRVTANGGTA